MPVPQVIALFFDVFGTVVDWRGSIARESEAILKPKGYALDWLAFADAWRNEYQPAMEEVRSGKIPFSKLDVLHRRNLERVLPRFNVASLDEATMQHFNKAWHRLNGWPDSALSGTAAAAQEVPDRAGFERQHLVDGQHRAAQRFPLGRDPRLRDRRRLQAEAARLSARRGGLRLRAGGMHDGRGAFERSRLRGGDRAWRTGHIARPNEKGPGKGEAKPSIPVDVAAPSIEGLADALGA